MAEYRTSFVVDASPDEVVAYVADLRNLPDWDSSVREAAIAADTGPAVGRRFDVTIGFYGRAFDAIYEIVEFDCHSTVAWTIDGKATGTTRVRVEPHERGSQIEYHLAVTMSGFARLLDRGLSAALEGIGDNVEKGLQRELRR